MQVLQVVFLANRIISNTNYNVLLIEAGPRDNSPVIHIPLGYGMTFYNKKINWNFYSDSQNNLFNREIYYPRGKVLGGSSSINGMVYARGLNTDYDNWSLNSELSLSNIKQSFDEIEQTVDSSVSNLEQNKVPVNDVSDSHHPLLKYFFNGCRDMGIKFNKNLNSDIADQVGHYNITTFKGSRYSSSKIFLKSILKNKRLTLLTKACVKKIIFKNKKVKTIEILNTDAEGRLVLADALTFTEKKFQPKFIIDLATLTGAIIVCLGSEYAGLFSNDDKLSNQIFDAGEKVEEKVWRMPLHKNYDKLMNSKNADVQNINYVGGAGSTTAAQFLQRFILNNTPWAHLDIAGMAFSKYGGALNSGGATGFGVRLLNQLVEDNYE